MKNKLTLLALAMLCYGHMQAEGWFANRWNSMKSYIPSSTSIREYTPYQQGSFKVYSPENVTSRLASMRYLYGDTQAQEQLIEGYYAHLQNKLSQQEKKIARFKALENYRMLGLDFTDLSEGEKQEKHKAEKKCSTIYGLRENFRPTIRQQEAEMLRPGSYYQYQHPDQYILNN